MDMEIRGMDDLVRSNFTTSRNNQEHPVVFPFMSHFMYVPLRTPPPPLCVTRACPFREEPEGASSERACGGAPCIRSEPPGPCSWAIRLRPEALSGIDA